MKRVFVILIVLGVMTTLFAFPVFADTAISPVQVMSYVDTTTNLKIYGTAQRLQYNIDSIQVILTNPPDNYGSACTPILVSFRFANSGNLPAYISTPQFEITATNSTGNINTIVYGYDPISTDLFISNYNYDSQNIGRITIAPAQEFSYYSGFVIPPNESIYFSAIVYVNSSAFETNNSPTGSSEQVNQIVMSALNFYSGQISFSDDYPYSGMPTDFTDIIDAITDLSDNVSTSTEMQDLIGLITYSGNNVNYSLGNGLINSYDNNTNENYRIIAKRVIGNPVLSTADFEIDSTNDTLQQVGTVKYPVFMRILINTKNTNTKYVYYVSYVKKFFPTALTGFNVTYFKSNFYDDIEYNSLDLQFIAKHRAILTSSYANLPARSGIYINLIGYFEVPYGTTPDFSQIDFSHFYDNAPFTNSNEYQPIDEYSILRDLYLAFSNQANDPTSTAESMNDQIHQQEQTWYDNNSAALQQVGLSNYRFNSNQTSGITKAVTQFQAVWNALGNWTLVYVFILMLSLATYIVRHEPTTRVKQYRSSIAAERAERISYYSKLNAQSRAGSKSSGNSTLKNAVRRRH